MIPRAPLRLLTGTRFVPVDATGISISYGTAIGHWQLTLSCGHVKRMSGLRRPPKRSRCTECAASGLSAKAG
jgi:hypothetical protein